MNLNPKIYKFLNQFKRKLSKFYYTLMYPLAWLIYKIEDYSNNKLKSKVNEKFVVDLLVKDIYKNLCKGKVKSNSSSNDDFVLIAEYVSSDSGYQGAKRLINCYTKHGSKTRKSINYLKNKDLNYLIELTLKEFNSLNKYTYSYEIIEESYNRDYWDMKGYKKTIYFGIRY